MKGTDELASPSRAAEAGVIIDSSAYFRALRESIAAARRDVYILGWDVDSRTRLSDDDAPKDGGPPLLLDFLKHVLDTQKDLRIHVLAWDFSMIYLFEREALPSIRFANAHARLSFALDGEHPGGASHHQKIVVVDDSVAFVGGIDLTIRRWDTPSHSGADARRVDPSGEAYAPMHDVAICVSGPVAQELGLLARQRMARANGRSVAKPEEAGASRVDAQPWPASVKVQLRNVKTRITRTQAAVTPHERDVRETLDATLDVIRRAEKYVFFENQYLTAQAVADAICARLAEPAAPDFIVVLPREECGWLERSSMGALRAHVLARLHAADAHGHFHTFYPDVPGLEGTCVNVHSKLIIADDRVLKVGSSNLSNRSMGLDTECDVWLDADDDPDRRAAVTGVLCDLLGEHCAVEAAEVARRIAHTGSVIGAIESFAGNARALKSLPPPDRAEPLSELSVNLADPERPMAAETFASLMLPDTVSRPQQRAFLSILGVGVSLLFLAGLIWMGRAYGPGYVTWLHHVARSTSVGLGPVLIVLGIGVGSALFVPITLLTSAMAFAFEPLYAIGYALSGGLVGAALAYIFGRALGSKVMRRWGGRRTRAVEASLRAHGLRSTIVARVLPIGNFTMINIVAGSLGIRFWQFIVGSFIGMVPGTIGLTLIVRKMGEAFEKPSLGSMLAFGACVLAFIAFTAVFARFVGKRRATRREARSLSLPLRETSP